MSLKPELTFFIPDTENAKEFPFIADGIKAGFPSPAADFEEMKLSLDHLLIKNREATFYAKASGNSMIGAGIDDGDILVIDRSIEPTDNKIAVCFIDGDFTIKRIKIEEDCIYLQPENPKFKSIKVTEDNNLIIWGIVTYVVKKV